jgi:inorganic pyrophosphatase
MASIGSEPESGDVHRRCAVRVVVEQPAGEPNRLQFDPTTGVFERTFHRSLLHARGFTGAYGWVVGFGTPPGRHLDALLVTSRRPAAGSVVPAYVCGVLLRGDGDHKLVTVDAQETAESPAPDLALLPMETRRELFRLYPSLSQGEGWRGAERALSLLRRWRADTPGAS